MNILLIGLNHRTAPVEVREQLAFSREGVSTALLLFRNRFPKSEAAILSTCNRVEILIAAEGDVPSSSDAVAFIAQARDLPVNQFRPYLYELSGEQACRHFYRVASGLDSMILGESQIVDQVKQAYAAASEQGTTGRVLNRLFHHAFRVSKRVRTETKIGEGKVSISSVAVDTARTIFDDFSTKRTLVVGAGEMARLVCQSLKDADVRQFVVTTRTLANARTIADACDAQAVPFAKLDEELGQADIVITATACPEPFITAQRIKSARAKRYRKRLFMIDLAVPRNVHSDVASLPDVFVYDVDALGKIVAENQQQRYAQIEICERILDEEVVNFEHWLAESRINPLIEQMYEDARRVCERELERVLRRCPDLSEREKSEVTKLAHRLAGKFMHPCVSTLRSDSLQNTAPALAWAWHATASGRRTSDQQEADL